VDGLRNYSRRGSAKVEFATTGSSFAIAGRGFRTDTSARFGKARGCEDTGGCIHGRS
jgi:hypothetical protein